MEIQDLLASAGLSEGESIVYKLLIERGEMKAGDVIRRSGLKRGNVYNILHSLVGKNLAEEFEKNGVAHYRSLHPTHLLSGLEKEKRDLERRERALGGALDDLARLYSESSNKPGVSSWEGAEGIEKLYQDILKNNENFLLIRSPLDEAIPEIASLVANQIKKQVAQKITVRAITENYPGAEEEVKTSDPGNLVTRRVVPVGTLPVPAQIIVYGDTVAITSFKRPLMTTQIKNNHIAETFRILFEFIWNQAQTE